MRFDIVIPKNNEEALYEAALKLSKEPIFLYSNISFKELELKLKRLETFENYKTAYLFSPESPSKMVLDKNIRKKVDYIIGTSQDLKTIRALSEKSKIDFIVDIETSGGRDHTHYRRSNFNQVIAKFCKQNKISFLVDFYRIRAKKEISRAILLGRIMQNATFCRKEKVEVYAMSFARSPEDLINNDCLTALQNII